MYIYIYLEQIDIDKITIYCFQKMLKYGHEIGLKIINTVLNRTPS